MVAAHGLLDPEFAVGALLEVGTLHQLLELDVVLVLGVGEFEFLAGLLVVPGHPAFETVGFLALAALEFGLFLVLLPLDRVLAVGCHAPDEPVSCLLHHVVQRVVVEEVHLLFGKHLLHVWHADFASAASLGTDNVSVPGLDLGVQIILQAVSVEDVVTTLEGHHILLFVPCEANWAQQLLLPDRGFLAPCQLLFLFILQLLNQLLGLRIHLLFFSF